MEKWEITWITRHTQIVECEDGEDPMDYLDENCLAHEMCELIGDTIETSLIEEDVVITE